MRWRTPPSPQLTKSLEPFSNELTLRHQPRPAELPGRLQLGARVLRRHLLGWPSSPPSGKYHEPNGATLDQVVAKGGAAAGTGKRLAQPDGPGRQQAGQRAPRAPSAASGPVAARPSTRRATPPPSTASCSPAGRRRLRRACQQPTGPRSRPRSSCWPRRRASSTTWARASSASRPGWVARSGGQSTGTSTPSARWRPSSSGLGGPPPTGPAVRATRPQAGDVRQRGHRLAAGPVPEDHARAAGHRAGGADLGRDPGGDGAAVSNSAGNYFNFGLLRARRAAAEQHRVQEQRRELPRRRPQPGAGRDQGQGADRQVVHGPVRHFPQQGQGVQEPGGTFLDNSLVMWGNHMGDGGAHSAYQIAWILAGKAGGAISPASTSTAAPRCAAAAAARAPTTPWPTSARSWASREAPAHFTGTVGLARPRA